MNEIQDRILSIFKVVAKICDEHDIPYYAIGGTCIGAVRHKGFIPWDDDIDIAIPIEQFERFQALANEHLPPNLRVYTCKSAPHFGNIFMKVIDEDTAFLEDSVADYPDSYRGVFVDIMPISGIPAPGLGRHIFLEKIRVLSSLNCLRRFPKSHAQGTVKKLGWQVLHWFDKSVPFYYFSEKWYKLLKKHPFQSAQYVGYVWHNRVGKLIFSKSQFSDTVSLPFENTVMKCPQDWDGYLTQQFGDYMSLPPEEQRVSLHHGVIDLSRSYKEYQEAYILKSKGRAQ